MGYNEVAKPVFKIERPYTYKNIVRAMAGNENDVVYHRIQNHSHSTVLLFHPSENDVEQSYVEVQLRDTVILRYWEDGKITLNAGDWYTKWTRMYLNDWLKGIAEVVADKKNPWFLKYKGINYTFFNSMIIDTVQEEIIGVGFDVEAVKKQRQEIDRLIETWIKRAPYTELPRLIEGRCCDTGECEDCDYAINEKDHLLKHLNNFEYPGNLILNAYKNNGHPTNYNTAAYIDAFNGSGPIMYNNYAAPHMDDRMKKYLTRYLRRQLYTGPITF